MTVCQKIPGNEKFQIRNSHVKSYTQVTRLTHDCC